MRFTRYVASALVLTMGSMSIVMPVAQAGMLGTGQVMQSNRADQVRSQLDAALTRDDVRQKLEGLGVDPAQAQARVAGLTDEEAQALADRMDQLPAGGDGLIGALVFIFIVLLITDIAGLTHVFPFVNHKR